MHSKLVHSILGMYWDSGKDSGDSYLGVVGFGLSLTEGRIAIGFNTAIRRHCQRCLVFNETMALGNTAPIVFPGIQALYVHYHVLIITSRDTVALGKQQ